jgi:isopentenyl-diphosphate delta-isomerase type 1
MPLDDQSELFYWVDENDNILGHMTRAEAHSGTSKIHRAAVAFIFDLENKYVLFQQRTLTKDMCPGYWGDSVGGHVTFGQAYDDAIQRETEEELGLQNIKLKFHSKHLFELRGEREYYAIYTGHIPLNADIHFDHNEIQQVKWIGIGEIEWFLLREPCTPGLIQSWAKIKVGFPIQ